VGSGASPANYNLLARMAEHLSVLRAVRPNAARVTCRREQNRVFEAAAASGQTLGVDVHALATV